MRKFASLATGVVIACVYVGLTAAPALAAHRHHHHHHHGGRGPTCGAGTLAMAGSCTPGGPTGPRGDSNVIITPSDITMTLLGNFSTNVVVKGLSPLGSGIVTSPALAAACTGGDTIDVIAGSAGLTGELAIVVTGQGCVPGTYPIVVTQFSAPIETFTGFLTLHF